VKEAGVGLWVEPFEVVSRSKSIIAAPHPLSQENWSLKHELLDRPLAHRAAPHG
jgi:hypothetical protein